MSNIVEAWDLWRWRGWRIVGWGTAALLLLVPLIAMQWTDEVKWTGGDFLFAGGMFAIVGGAFELAVRASDRLDYRAGAGLALIAGLLLVWVNGAVGIIGDEGNPANLMFGGVLLVAIAGAIGAGGRAGGMARAMAAAAAIQLAVGAIAFDDDPAVPWATLVFAGLWLISAALFRRAAQ